MNRFEGLVYSRSIIVLLRARLGWMVASSLLLSCTASHRGDTSTETGNPPVIDVHKVGLVVTDASVSIVGQPGAVSPGGVPVEVTIVGTGEVVRRTSKADGSFEVPLLAGEDAVVEVRAAVGDARSSIVYVTRGGASVGSGEGASLSCMERTNLASHAAGSLANSANTSCDTAADCAEVSTQTACTDSCGPLLVASSTVAGIEAGIESINRELCGSFASDGCSVIAQPCPAPPAGPIACVEGQCTRQECPSCLSETVSWTSGRFDMASTYTISKCDSFHRTVPGEPDCEGIVAHCGTTSDKPTLEELISALQDPQVEAAFESGATLGGMPPPGGFSTRVNVGSRSFVIVNPNNSPYSEPLPEAIQRLYELLVRLAHETECTRVACPPNSIWMQSACASCGAAGGCGSYFAGCALVCSGAGDGVCSGTAGFSCSARGICEAGPCL